ncbi:MAG TPA: hypothetical protein VEF05_10420 [Terriglobales bacterium]|nr:hypothetical protein [Terriglobales bacterium]
MTTSPQLRESPETAKCQGFPDSIKLGAGGTVSGVVAAFFGPQRQLQAKDGAKAQNKRKTRHAQVLELSIGTSPMPTKRVADLRA